jgi:transcriptional regulator with XRE-family HTH domain
MKNIKRKTKGTPNSVDVYVGSRLRVRRSLLGLSQEKLAEAIGLTFQQVQKYERGMNRISAGRLYQFAHILEVPISYFFEQMVGAENQNIAAFGMSDNKQEEFQSNDVMHNKETLDLIRAYYTIEDPQMRKTIYRFVKSMSDRMGEPSAEE